MPPAPLPLPPKISHRLWGFITAAYAALVLFVSVIPVSPQLAPGRLDKVAHLCEYALLAWLLAQFVRGGRMPQRLPAPPPWLREDVLRAWLYATSYGLLIELAQAMLPWRSAEVGDLLANALGAGLGVWIGKKAKGSKQKAGKKSSPYAEGSKPKTAGAAMILFFLLPTFCLLLSAFKIAIMDHGLM